MLNMRFYRSPFWLKWLYSKNTWNRSRSEKVIYLTFDDGPIPDVTSGVLNILKKYGIKATFFCVGENVAKHPELFKRLKDEEHQIGNHTYNHLKGWNTPIGQYLDNVSKCHELAPSKLFRPPYGQGTSAQYKKIRAHYEIIMWDVISYDFDQTLDPRDCLSNTIRHTKPGSIVVFHDNLKATTNLFYALPRYIEHCLREGYRFQTL